MRIFFDKRFAHLRTDFKNLWTDGRTKPGHDIARGVFKAGDCLFQHTRAQPPPSGMGGGDFSTRTIAKENRQAVGGHHSTNCPWRIAVGRIGTFRSVGFPRQPQHIIAMHLLKPYGF
ncbi:hypothetical protein D3C86_1890350 [compost metagenome]